MKAQPPARPHEQLLLPPVAASRSRLPSPSAVPRRNQALSLHTCRICHRLIPGPTASGQRLNSPAIAAAACGSSHHDMSAMERSLEADVARALVSTLQRHSRPHSGSAFQMVRHQHTELARDAAAEQPK